MQTYFLSVRGVALLAAAVFVGTFSAKAAVVLPPPGGLTAARSGKDLNLSFPSAGLNFYMVQVSSDLRHWSNCPPGVMGDGTVKTVTMTNAASSGLGFYRLIAQSPTQLFLPQSTAFAILGHSCGGIQEKVSAGFDVNTGYPAGVVDLSTSCGGSGRDGGGHTTKYTAAALVVWDFAGNVVSATPLTNGVAAPTTTGTDQFGDVIYSPSSVAYLIVPVPAAPTAVVAVQASDQFQVSWTPNGVNPLAILSSTLTATPVNSTASVLTATVTGRATTGIIPSLQPQTTYQITVANTTLGGSGQPSSPISLTTLPATIAPSAPAGVSASWSNLNPTGPTDTLTATWQAADPGNSPVDQYLITIIGSDGGGTFSQTVSGTALTAYFTVDWVPNWSGTVQAHNAAGWGPVSAIFNLGGL